MSKAFFGAPLYSGMAVSCDDARDEGAETRRAPVLTQTACQPCAIGEPLPPVPLLDRPLSDGLPVP
jgi:hypothetical protein